MIQETKLRKEGASKIDGYCSFDLVRSESGGGGVTILVENSLISDPVLIMKGDDSIEILVVEISLGIMKIRLISGYGPLENENENLIKDFYSKLDEEIQSAIDAECEILIEMDFNAKIMNENKMLGNNLSRNGRYLFDLIKRNGLFVANSSSKCQGIITRERKTINGIERSIIDYIIVSDGLKFLLKQMTVDESRHKVLTKYGSKKGNNNIKVSDFHSLRYQRRDDLGLKIF